MCGDAGQQRSWLIPAALVSPDFPFPPELIRDKLLETPNCVGALYDPSRAGLCLCVYKKARCLLQKRPDRGGLRSRPEVEGGWACGDTVLAGD